MIDYHKLTWAENTYKAVCVKQNPSRTRKKADAKNLSRLFNLLLVCTCHGCMEVYVFIYCWQKTSTSHYGL